MMLRLLKGMFSTKMSLLLLLILIVSMAVATFIENDYGTLVARTAVYEAWWFELILIWLSANFCFQIRKYKLLSKNKLPIGLFHLAFVVIIIGAGITRYISKEGIIHMREGQVVSQYTTNEKYMLFKSPTNIYERQVQPIPYRFEQETLHIDDQNESFDCILTEYISNATLKYVDGNQTFVDITTSFQGQEQRKYVYENSYIVMDNFHIHFAQNNSLPLLNEVHSINEEPFYAIYINKRDDLWQFFSETYLHSIQPHAQQMATIPSKTWTDIKPNTLYKWGENSFVINGIYERKKMIYVSDNQNKKTQNDTDKVKLEIYKEGQLLSQKYFDAKSQEPQWETFHYKDKEYAFAYASKQVPLPFALKLNRFELKRYPGSQSAESYKSYVQVIDKHTNGTNDEDKFDYQIYMNNVLDYKGYRFYQSSYDSDEKGTLLAVNKDRIGTWLTYFGYALLFVAMFWTLFSKASRFQYINRRLQRIKKHLLVAFVLISFAGYSTEKSKTASLNTIAEEPAPYFVPLDKAQTYGRLIVQGADGRMKPLTTLAYEITRKLTGKTSVMIGKRLLTPEQFLLAIQLDPEFFSQQPLIQVNKDKSTLIVQKLNLPKVNVLRFVDFLDENGTYRLKNDVEQVNQLKPSQRSEFEKELLKVDERFNILYALFSGNFLRLFPNAKAENNRWYAAKDFMEFADEDANFVKDIHAYYLQGIAEGIATNNFWQADEAWSYMDTFQKKMGNKVYPTENEIRAELFYTRTRVGNYLFAVCIVLGAILLAVSILHLFLQRQIFAHILRVGAILTWILLLAFTFDLLLRWYIAKHPPWSDGFEMLLFVSWGVLAFGLFFWRKSSFTLPLGLLFSGVLLLVSFLDWLNPEITTLKPVLYSYWLKIHVAVIVSSYAPLSLSCVTALLSLLLLIFKPLKPSKKWWKSMQELVIVQEMSITIGLFLLTAGTFLGGIWANESWGRYWAWDPKETWALISILTYAIVAHLRLIPSFKNSLVYHLATMWAFSVIIMTSYGVNYYLVGLHSYATGDPVPIPSWVYILVGILVIISLFATWQYRKLSRQERKMLY